MSILIKREKLYLNFSFMGCCKIELTLILTYFEEIVTKRENQEFFFINNCFIISIFFECRGA